MVIKIEKQNFCRIIFPYLFIIAVIFLLYVYAVSFSFYHKTNQEIKALEEPCFESSTVDFSNVGVYSGIYEQVLTPPFGEIFLYLRLTGNQQNLGLGIFEGLICDITLIDSLGGIAYKGKFNDNNYSDSDIGLGTLESEKGTKIPMLYMHIGKIPVGTYELKIEVEKRAEKLRDVDYRVIVKNEISVLPILKYTSLLIFLVSLILLFLIVWFVSKKVRKNKD